MLCDKRKEVSMVRDAVSDPYESTLNKFLVLPDWERRGDRTTKL
jgi:hypothetical protein